MRTIDLNADLGEHAGDDAAMLDLISSANIACGAHAGDRATMERTCAIAIERGVVIGAHPGYADRPRFGRVDLGLTPDALARSLGKQLEALTSAARAAGARVQYLKPHGALYHRAGADEATAAVVVGAAQATDPPLAILGPPGSRLVLHGRAAALDVHVEGFADRAYVLDAAGLPTLLGRDQPGAVLGHDAAVEQALALATTGLACVAGAEEPVAVHPRSICVHGDTPGAVALAREIREELRRASIVVEPFAG